jgi:hypothetical protein
VRVHPTPHQKEDKDRRGDSVQVHAQACLTAEGGEENAGGPIARILAPDLGESVNDRRGRSFPKVGIARSRALSFHQKASREVM